jgi:hypothetical protein
LALNNNHSLTPQLVALLFLGGGQGKKKFLETNDPFYQADTHY